MTTHRFPRTAAQLHRVNFGFHPGDLVRADVLSGVAAGVHVGGWPCVPENYLS
jgi:hypothetical protein